MWEVNLLPVAGTFQKTLTIHAVLNLLNVIQTTVLAVPTKLLIPVCTIFVLSFINSSDETDCSSKLILENFLEMFAGVRMKNGENKNCVCTSWQHLTIHKTIPNAVSIVENQSKDRPDQN